MLPPQIHRFGAVPHPRVQEHLNVVAQQGAYFPLHSQTPTQLPLLHKFKQLSHFVFAERWAWLTLLSPVAQFGNWHTLADVALLYGSGSQPVPRRRKVVQRAGFGPSIELPVPPRLERSDVGVREFFQLPLAEVGHEISFNAGKVVIECRLGAACINLLPQIPAADGSQVCKRVCAVC
jgi:hypothetical protein